MDSQREYNVPGPSDESETSTHTAMALHLLNAGDMVKVKFNKVCFCFIVAFIPARFYDTYLIETIIQFII